MPGFKSKRLAAMTATPAQPRTLKWDEKLAKWEARAKEKYGWGDSDNVKSDCMDKMQAEYPGKYELIWSKIAPNVIHLRPVFKDPKHETLWLLKYGGS